MAVPPVLANALQYRYRLDRELGQGGMATVYLARDLKHDRDVALKLLRPELAAIIGNQRFLAEIRVTAGLEHPHILTLIESGEANGFLWYVVPFIRGESLRQKLAREKQLGVEEALAIGAQVAGALDYAHKQGVIHRDIKPENILLHEGEAMLADFGIALAVREAGGQRLTETGLSIGTPQYMSPEQATGDRELDSRSDVYSLAAVVYEMLAGEPPHSGATAQAVIAKLITTEPVSLRIIRPALPAAIDQVLRGGLAKVREDRYPTAGALLQALRRAHAIPDAHGGGPAHPAKIPKPLRALAAARWTWLVAIIVALFAGGYWLWWRSHAAAISANTPGDARRVAVLYFRSPGNNDSLRLLADGLTEELIAALAQVPELDVVSKNGAALFRGRDVSRETIAAALKAGTLIEGDVDPDGKQVRVTLQLVDAGSGAAFERASFALPAGAYLTMADSVAQRAADLLRERLGDELRLREQRSKATSMEAWLLLQRAERARREAQEAADAQDSAVTTRSFAEADSFARLASQQDKAWGAPVVFRASVLYQRSRLELSNPLLAKTLIEQGMALVDTALARDGNDPDALELRGNLQYWKYLLRLEQDPVAAAALRQRARNDLEQATRLRPTQAGAWASLSHLYYNDPTAGLTDVVLAARRAYEADAYLANARKIIERLFYAYYDLDQPIDAKRWCEEGGRRFPDEAAFTTCQLYLMTMRGVTPDPDKAWQLARSEVLTKASEFTRAEARMNVACVLARAGLKDSASALARSAIATSDVDPERFLYLQQAFAFVLADDKRGAVEALKTFLTANPERRADFSPDPGWKFRSLANEPAFRDLVGAN